jgi:bla regulator protein BlaR1
MIELQSPMLEVLVTSLGWTLLHFLWQGAVVGVLFGISLAFATRSSARTRYRIGLAYMTLLALLPVVTFLWLVPNASDTAAVTLSAPTLIAGYASAAAAAATDWRTLIDPYLPWTVLVWVFGVLLMTARLLLEWRDVRRLTRIEIESLSPEWQARVAKLRERLGVRRAVTVLRSARVHVPIVVGWLRPMILVPVSAFTGLTPWHLELIVMHELAHVRRHDYLVNLLQVIVETLLFYHPVVRWVSRVVREEREHCCDDLVVARSGDALGYARALTELAGAQSLRLQTSVGSDGGKLLVRIKRLVIAHEPQRVSTHWSVGAMLAAFGMSISSLLQPGAQRDPALDQPARTEVRLTMSASPIAEVAPLDALRDFVQSTRAMPTLAPSAPEETQDTLATSGAGETASAEPMVAPGDAPPAPESSAEAPAPSGSGPVIAAESSGEASQAAIETPVAPIAASAVESRAGTGTASAPAEAGSAVRFTRPVSGEEPEFPIDARLDGIEGWVKFSYVIGRDGTVRNVQIVAARPREVFESAVRKAVRGWRFEPIVVDGTAVEREMTQTIQFTLGRAVTDEELCLHETGTRLCRR